jgi:hypothetical protein
MLIEGYLSVMPEQGQQNDDRQWYAEQPKQCTSSKTHGFLHFLLKEDIL